MDPVSVGATLLQTDWPLSDVWGTTIGFITLFVIAVGAIGMLSRKLTIAMWGAYMTFVFFAVETDIVVLETTLYVTVTLVIIGTVFKLWRFEGLGEGV